MPFTLSHPAAAIPFLRSRLVLSALVIGSMMPDFWYFVRVTGQDREAHTFPGVIFVTFPLACLVLLIFQTLLKLPAISLMPTPLQQKMIPPARQFRWWPATRAALVVFSVALGIATHLIWDSFTHLDGRVVVAFPALRQPLFYVGRTAIPAFKVAQHLSTFAGLVLLLICAARWYSTAEDSSDFVPALVPDRMKLRLVGGASAVALAIGAVRAYSFASIPADLPGLQRFTGTFAVTSIAAAGILLLVYSAAWWATPSVRHSLTKALNAVSSH